MSLYAPYRVLFCHRSPSREDTTRTVPHDLGDSALSTWPRPVLDLASTQPRPTIGQQGEKVDVAQDSGSFYRLVLYVTMVSRDGWPFPGHVATATSTGIDKTSPQDAPGVPASSYPIKGQAGALQKKKQKQAKAEEQRTTDNEKPISFVLSLFPLRPGLGSLSHSL
jgi:hypothetical protein